MFEGGVPRLPVAPEQPPPEEDEVCSAMAAPLVGVCAPVQTPRLETLFDDWMRRLDRRLDLLSERLPPPLGAQPSTPLPQRATPPKEAPPPTPADAVPNRAIAAVPDKAASARGSTQPMPPRCAPPQQQPPQQHLHRASTGQASLSEAVAMNRAALAAAREDREDPPGRSGGGGADVEFEESADGNGSDRSEEAPPPDDKKWCMSTIVFAPKRASTAERISDHWANLERSTTGTKCFATRIVRHKWFDCTITTLVLFSAIMVGVQVDYEAANEGEAAHYFDYIEYICTGVFTCELALRIMAMGLGRLCSVNERGIFVVDVLLVVASWAEIALAMAFAIAGVSTNSPIGKVFKLFRIGRLMRMIRTVRVFTELRVMAMMIWNSFRSLTWLFFILVGLAYCFALVLTQGAAMYIVSNEMLDLAAVDEMKGAFGAVGLTMYSLFMAMTGGRNWGEIASLIAPAGLVYAGLIVLYVFMNLFSVLNIVTGVFVDGAIELGKRDRSMMIDKEGKKREAFAQHLVQLLRDMDTSGDGVITREEFLASFSRPEVKEFMYALSIDLDDAHNMFTLLDRNMDGDVDIVEFVMGMEKLRGEAKSSDIHFLIMQCQHITDLLMRSQGFRLDGPMWSSADCSPGARSSTKEGRTSRVSYRGLPGDLPGGPPLEVLFGAGESMAGRRTL